MSAGENDDSSATMNSSKEDLHSERTKQERSDSPTSLSCVSLKSERSAPLPMNFSDEEQRNKESKMCVEIPQEHAESTPAKGVCQHHHRDLEIFCKTDNMYICGICAGQEHQRHRKTYTAKPNVSDCKTLLYHVLGNMGLEDFKTFKIVLSKDYPECLGSELEELIVSDVAEKIAKCFGGETALRITLHFQANGNPLKKITEANKAKLRNECQHINEGNSSEGKQNLLKEIYTDLYMTEGGSEEINNEYEVLRDEMISQSRTSSPLTCNDIFKIPPGQNKQIRTVLTMGIGGIGKNVSVHKFILDWVDGIANQDIQIIIHLRFRDLNQKKGNCSLLQLIQQYAPQLKETNVKEMKVLFILDGLAVCQYPLDFDNNDQCADTNVEVPLDVLLTNLIKGNLLPSALLWITTRPSTANRIPPECVHQVTEIRGFNDNQKETYFRKKITDQKLANEIITHIKSCRSLYIMCHMPIFCWISATVLENMMKDENSDQIPRTLTEMFTRFLLIQISLKHKKFNGADADNPEKLSEFDKKLILDLGKLAFQQLEKGNWIFQEEDLKDGGLDVSKVSEYSVCTEIFREELGLYREKAYSFVHLSYQEYLAAIYAHFACVNNGKNVLDKDESTHLSDLHKCAVNKALESENGHLDLFLRFLLGLSVDPNCTLLQDLLTKDSSSKPCVDKKMTVHLIQETITQEQSPDRIINLFHCLNELNDNTLVKEIQTAMKSGTLMGSELEPEQWSALAYVLLKSGQELDEFDMKKFHTSTENHQRLLPVLRICKKARLNCNLSFESCGIVASALQSVNSPLRELDLSNNKLEKRGVNALLTGLTGPNCQLQTLSLAGCNFPSTSCPDLASALKSTNSHLRELDLSYTKISAPGMNKLCDGLISPHCRLQKLKLKRCWLTPRSCVYLASVLKCNLHLRELELTSNDLRDSGVEQLSIGLQDPQCKLEILGLSGCMITEEGCRSLALTLSSNTGQLRELDLSYNHPGDLGEKLLSAKKEDPNCKLEKLHVEKGGECRMKPGLKKYVCQLTVDRSTVHPRLKVSNGNKKISESTEEQKYPDHPDRFTLYPQAMCREPLTDRCYFEVECEGGVGVGVAYKTSDRRESIMGVKNTFPTLLCLDGKLKLWQDNEMTCEFPVYARSKRVGVYVDLEKGSLSYYSIHDKFSHLHTHRTTFEHCLYTGFIFLPDSSVTLCELT
ncbi:NACHT, LRR and PYD domains-containing protein 12 isoform X2 [Labeo rohita]|uniref:NACHT, LRR and PYD domains-containing protein 12 isoform X2 n=1 Tax=Labeo rohita TaxID=84645 RepID=UPI0021E1DED6|nr:NACHT, LRR and PYD domains-containing protein 12 isoform X2 [Labeo rohita]